MPLNLSPTQIAFNARGDGKFNLPFSEQISFFRNKLNLSTERWDDILHQAHDRAFIVAGAAKADLLDDLRLAVDKSIAEGKSLKWFRSHFNQIVQKHGWEGWTGSETKAGRDWRTRVIYQTNLSTSYAAGRYQQLTDPELLKIRPNWKYVHNDSVRHPRPLHVAWSGTVLPADDEWWDAHFPPNGFGCRCRITAVGADQYAGNPAPDNGDYIHIDKKGQKHTLPAGVDYGFGYTPGKSEALGMQPFIANKVASLPPQLGNAFKADIASLASKVSSPPPVSASLKLPKSGVAKNGMDTALTEIDKLHGVENLPEIPVKNSQSITFQGCYKYYVASGKPVDICISKASKNPALTAAHEIAHFIDHQAFGTPGKYASINDALLGKWRDAVNASSATENLKDILKTHENKIVRNSSTYYLSTHEQWARSYAQWVATRSKNPTMLEQVKKIIAHPTNNPAYSASQWVDADFEPIADAIDEIFRSLGWLK